MLWSCREATSAAPTCAASNAAVRAGRVAGVLALHLSAWCFASVPIVGFGQERTPVPVKVFRYAGHLVAKYDVDGDGRLQAAEWQRMDGNPTAADLDADGVIEVGELAGYIADYGSVRRIRLMPSLAQRFPSLLSDDLVMGGSSDRGGQNAARSPDEPGDDAAEDPAPRPPGQPSSRRFTVNPSRLPPGLPAWFLRLDSDGDGQLTQSEFAPTGSPGALQEFETYDHNGDGIITAKEAATGPRRSPDAPRSELR